MQKGCSSIRGVCPVVWYPFIPQDTRCWCKGKFLIQERSTAPLMGAFENTQSCGWCTVLVKNHVRLIPIGVKLNRTRGHCASELSVAGGNKECFLFLNGILVHHCSPLSEVRIYSPEWRETILKWSTWPMSLTNRIALGSNPDLSIYIPAHSQLSTASRKDPWGDYIKMNSFVSSCRKNQALFALEMAH